MRENNIFGAIVGVFLVIIGVVIELVVRIFVASAFAATIVSIINKAAGIKNANTWFQNFWELFSGWLFWSMAVLTAPVWVPYVAVRWVMRKLARPKEAQSVNKPCERCGCTETVLFKGFDQFGWACKECGLCVQWYPYRAKLAAVK